MKTAEKSILSGHKIAKLRSLTYRKVPGPKYLGVGLLHW